MRRFLGCLIFIIFCLSLSGLTQPVSATEEQEIQKLIVKTKQAILNQKKKEKSVLTNLNKQQQELNQLEGNYDQLKGKLSTAKKKAILTQQEQQQLERSLGILKKNLSYHQKILNERIIVTYKYGPKTYLEILFHPQNFVDLISRFSMINYFIKKDIESINLTQQAKVEVDREQQIVLKKKQQAEKELKKIIVLQTEVVRAQQKVATKVDQTKKELSKIQTNRQQLEKALEEYEQTSREIGNQIQENGKAFSEVLGSGKLIWPVRGRLSSNFGWRFHPVLKKKKLHNGQDIAVSAGTPVHAADNGIIVVSGWQGGYGNFIAIDHGNGVSTCYGHNSRLVVGRGERVTKGQVIAYSGNTGLSSGPHVHFEVRRNGVPVNPIPYLP